MKAPSEDTCDMLAEVSSLGLTFAINLFRGREPESPINCVTVYDTPGFGPDLTMDSNTDEKHYERPSIQIRVRNSDYDDAYKLIHNIMNSLHGRAGETWNGSLYTLIRCSTEPHLLEWNGNNKAIFIANFNLQRR